MKLPPTFKFRGNTDLAIKYKAKALSLYNLYTDVAERDNISFIHKTFNFLDGTSIEFTSSKESNYLHRVGDISVNSPPSVPTSIDSFLYMETGFAQYNFKDDLPIYNENRPSKIWYNDYINSYMVSSSNKLQGNLNTDTLVGEPLNSGFISLSSGCRKLTNTLIIDSGPFISDTEEFCDLTEDTNLANKEVQIKVKPSNFSGKLRLYIQALYGSTKGDYSIIPMPNRDLFFVNGVELPYGEYLAGSCGLFTKAPGEYYLLILKNGTVEIRELERSSSSDKLVSHLVNGENLGKEKYTQIEAYILSTCKVSKKYVTIPIALNESLIGSPLAYGWNFNWNGDKASIILHIDDEESGWIYAKQYTLSIGYNEISKEFYTTLDSLGSPRPWSAVSNIKVFVTSKFLGASIAKINPVKPGGYSLSIAGKSVYSANIYCFYDSEDNLLNLKVDEDFSESGDTGVVSVNQVFAGNGVITTRSIYDIGHTLRVSLGGTVLDVQAEGRTRYEEEGLFQAEGGTSYIVGPGITRYDNIKQYGIEKYYISDDVDASVFIPLNDCSSVIMCSRKFEELSSLSKTVITTYVYPTGVTDEGNPASPPYRLFNQAGAGLPLETPFPTHPTGLIKVMYVSNNQPAGVNLSTIKIDSFYTGHSLFNYNSISDPTTHIITFSKNSVVSKGYDVDVTEVSVNAPSTYPFETSIGWA